jgi:REP element-mobilizing transposase RayT
MHTTPFLDRNEPVHHTRDDLPHWHQPDRLQFITWNLGDAIPAKALARLKRERERWLMLHPPPLTPDERRYYFDHFTDRIDRWQDLGRGCCLFRSPRAAKQMADILHFHEDIKIRLDAFVIMPNHIHVLAQLIGDTTVSSIMHSWRSYSGLQLNRLRGKQGKCWSDDFWDRTVRSPEQYWRIRRYINENPARAGIQPGTYLLWMRNPPLWEILKQEGCDLRPPRGELKDD